MTTMISTPNTQSMRKEKITRLRASFAFALTKESSLPFVLKRTRGIIKFANGTTHPIKNDQCASEAKVAFGSSLEGLPCCSSGTVIFAINYLITFKCCFYQDNVSIIKSYLAFYNTGCVTNNQCHLIKFRALIQ
jgi:hypothetical protein